MIEDGAITHRYAEKFLRNWEPRSDLLRELLISVLTTILAYQIYAIGQDILFGIKKRGQAKVSDLGIVLLSQENSISAVVTSISSSRTFSRLRYHLVQPDCDDSDGGKRVPPRVIFKFLVAVALGLIAIYFSNLLVVEQDKVFSFKDVGFGGISFGMNEDLAVVKSVMSDTNCRTFATRYGLNEIALTSFLLCYRGTENVKTEGQNTTTLQIRKGVQETIDIELKSSNFSYRMVTFIDLQSEEKRYRLKETLSLGIGQLLMDFGMKRLQMQCGGNESLKHNIRNFPGESAWQIIGTMRCTSLVRGQAKGIVFAMQEKLTVIDSEAFEIVELDAISTNKPSTGSILSGEDLPFIQRTGGIVGAGLLLIICLVVTFCRIVTDCVTNNDTERGLETVLKDGLNVKCCDSALQIVQKRNYGERSPAH